MHIDLVFYITRRHPSISLSCTRTYTTKPIQAKAQRPTVHIPAGSSIYAIGPPYKANDLLLRDFGWTVKDGEAWAIISGRGGRGKKVIYKTLLGKTRITPPASEHQWAEQGGLYPFLSTSTTDPYTGISHVAFHQRTGDQPGEDCVTLRDNLIPPGGSISPLFETLTVQMNMTSLLDLPFVSLNNGQMRLARILEAILDNPKLLILDDPLTGLDTESRDNLNEVLAQLHSAQSPRIIQGVAQGEEVPDWVTHILEVRDGTAFARPSYSSNFKPSTMNVAEGAKLSTNPVLPLEHEVGDVVVDMKDVNVKYGFRQVLKNITWKIKLGEKWHLQGVNGSGKTTLLALLTGDHPQSYTQAHLYLPSLNNSPTSSTFTTPSHNFTLCARKQTPTTHLRKLVGVVSPEMFDAFPRRHPGMNVWEAVGTGFNGGFVPRNRQTTSENSVGWVDVDDDELGSGWCDLSDHEKEIRREDIRKWRVERCWEVLEALGPAAWSSSRPPKSLQSRLKYKPSPDTLVFASINFSSISPGEQRLVLLMRALVGRPPLVLLDEIWSGMNDGMINAARRYLRGDLVGNADGHVMAGIGKDQAVVVITHRVPWAGKEVKKFKLG